MTEQPPSAASLWTDLVEKDDRTSPEEYPDMALITFDEFEHLLDHYAAQRVAAETERWQSRDRQRLEQISTLQKTVQSFQSARDERPATDPLEQTRQSGFEQGIAAAAEYVEARPNEQPAVLAGLMRDLGSMYAAERPAPPAAVADYAERARSMLEQWMREWGGETRPYAGSMMTDLRGRLAAALSAVASERDAAAIRAFGQRVWSDTEEVAYQAGVNDTRARLQEPDVREAVRRALAPLWKFINPNAVTASGPIAGIGEGLARAQAAETRASSERAAHAAIARIVEVLK